MFSLAKKNKIEIPYSSAEDVKKAYEFDSLQSFLDIYDASSKVLVEEQDFFDLTDAYLKKAKEDNISHVEIFFDPQTHMSRGVSFEVVLKGISRALEEGEKSYGITSYLIMCFLRHLSEEAAFEVLEESVPYKNKIIGVGLDSSELGNPPEKFEKVFKKARDEGYRIVAHAGEEGPPEYIWQALDLLKAERIDHGVRCLEDPKLVQRLAAEKIPLTVCPFSNVKLRVFKELKEHNLTELMDRGLNVSLHSDDPSYFGGYLLDNYLETAEALKLGRESIQKLCQNSIQSSFLPESRKKELQSQIADIA